MFQVQLMVELEVPSSINMEGVLFTIFVVENVSETHSSREMFEV